MRLKEPIGRNHLARGNGIVGVVADFVWGSPYEAGKASHHRFYEGLDQQYWIAA